MFYSVSISLGDKFEDRIEAIALVFRTECVGSDASGEEVADFRSSLFEEVVGDESVI